MYNGPTLLEFDLIKYSYLKKIRNEIKKRVNMRETGRADKKRERERQDGQLE